MQDFLLALPVLLLSMVAHEYAHGYAALTQGDRTAYELGRLTFNPLKHIDLWYTVLLPVLLFVGSGGRVIFGGAKPVPVNPRNYRHYRSGDLIVSSAGIVTNLGLAVLFVALTVVLGLGGSAALPVRLLQRMCMWGIWLNLLLAFFNVLPIPPLDGSHLLYQLLPPALAARYRQVSRFGILILVAILFLVPSVLYVLLTPAFALQHVACSVTAPFRSQAFPLCSA